MTSIYRPLAAMLGMVVLAIARIETRNPTDQIVPGRFMVEYQDTYDASTFMEDLETRRLSTTPGVQIDSRIFKGGSYQFSDADLGDNPMHLLTSLPAIKNVWPVYVVGLPKDELHWRGDKPMPEDLEKTMARLSGYAPHAATQVDRLHDEGITGQGIKIGIIDTGVDYNHPALGGCFGPGCLVESGYDFVDNKPDPLDTCHGHGTHVAGIISAQENEFGFIGAAPNATIGMYRALDCTGNGLLDAIDASIIRAFEDGSDIITASLGGSGGFAQRSTNVIIDRIIAEGVLVTFAQGNDGYDGPWFPSAPADGETTFAIGSTDNTELGRFFQGGASYSVDGEQTPFGWTLGIPGDWENITRPLYVVSGTNDGGCDLFQNAPADLSDYVILLERTPYCSLGYMLNYSSPHGVDFALIYNAFDGEGTYPEDVQEFIDLGWKMPRGIGTVPSSTAEEWMRLDIEGKAITIAITDPSSTDPYVDTIPNPLGGVMSEFSSWGPTFNLNMKPDISAPGGMILSTYLQSVGGYAIVSGTSMATPLAAGIAALILSARRDISPLELHSILRTTAKPLTLSSPSETPGVPPRTDLTPTHHQGGGLIQAWNALHAVGLSNVSKILLNDTEYFVKSHEITFKNTGDEEVTYLIGHRPAMATYWRYPSVDLDFLPAYAEVELSETSITLSPGQEAAVAVTFSPPDGLDVTRSPLYSGYILFDGTNGETHTIPYLGAAFRMRDQKLYEVSRVTSESAYPWNPFPADHAFVIPEDPNNITWGVHERPATLAEFAFGIRQFDVNLVRIVNDTEENMGRIEPWFPLRNYLPTWFSLYTWSGYLEDGSRVPEGKYFFLQRALKIFGDPEKEENWEVRRTYNFTITYRP